MKEDPSDNQKTSGVKGASTSPLEQLPPTKKRDLRTGSLNAATPGVTPPAPHEPEVEIRPPQPPRASEPRASEPRASAPQEAKPAVPAPVKIVPPQPPTFPSPQLPEPVASAHIEPPVPFQTPPVPPLPEPEPRSYEPPIERAVEAPIPAPSYQREPSFQPALSRQPAAEPVYQHTARTEAVKIEPAFAAPTEHVKSSSAGDVELFGFGGYVDKPAANEPPRSIWRSIALLSIPIILLLITSGLLIKYVPGLRDRMHARIASLFGGRTNVLPQVSVQEYRTLLDEKENAATLSGIITNISSDPVGPVQVELELSKREDVRLTEKKIVSIEPAQLAPNETGKYEVKISAKDYQQSKVSRILVGSNALRVKKLKELLEPKPPTDPNEIVPGQVEQPSQPKPDPNKVYDGSVSFSK